MVVVVVVVLFCFVLFCLRERENEERSRKRREQRIQSRLCTDNGEPNAGLELTNSEIMT